MKTITAIILLFISTNSFAQIQSDFENIKLEIASDYQPAESAALEISCNLLSKPFQKDDLITVKSLKFLLKWISGTPDFSFALNDARKIFKRDKDLIGIYSAAMVKYSLQNRSSIKDIKIVKLNALLTVLDYSCNGNNNIIMTRQLKKLHTASNQGKLNKVLR